MHACGGEKEEVVAVPKGHLAEYFEAMARTDRETVQPVSGRDAVRVRRLVDASATGYERAADILRTYDDKGLVLAAANEEITRVSEETPDQELAAARLLGIRELIDLV